MAKIEIFQLHIDYSTTTMRVKISVKMALSLTVSEILTFFLFFRKNSRWPPKVAKIENFQFCIEYFPTTLRVKNSFQFCIEYFCTTLWVKNSVEIALSLTVSKILANFSKVVLKIHNEVPKWLLLMY